MVYFRIIYIFIIYHIHSKFKQTVSLAKLWYNMKHDFILGYLLIIIANRAILKFVTICKSKLTPFDTGIYEMLYIECK